MLTYTTLLNVYKYNNNKINTLLVKQ